MPGKPIGPAVGPGDAALAQSPTSAQGDRPQVDLAQQKEPLAISFVTGAPPSTGAVITPLPEAETQALLARVEPLPDLLAQNANAPTMKPPTAPPATGGTVQEIAFFKPTGAAVKDGPLSGPTVASAPAAPLTPLDPPEILPTGEVRAEIEVRVRFRDPMVPVAKVGDAVVPPVTITPAVTGHWRWKDTRVLAFTVDEKSTRGRLRGATTYTVTVPAGTASIEGRVLEKSVTSTFTTAPIALGRVSPGAVRPDTALAVPFTQAIDEAKLFASLSVKTAKGAKVPVRRATAAEVKASWSKIRGLANEPVPAGDQVMYLAPQTAWPAGAELVVSLDKGAPSAEGPLLTKRPGTAAFTVARPFTVLGIDCHDDGNAVMNARCPAAAMAGVEFTNQIEMSTYRSEKIQLVGGEFADHTAYHSSVRFWVPEVVGKRFEVAIGDGLEDTFGQPYTGPRRVAFTTLKPRYGGEVEAEAGMRVLDPRYAIPQWPISAVNIGSLRVDLYRVTPADYFAYQQSENSGAMPGTRISSKTYTVGASHAAELRVDLRPALTDGVGHVVAVATSTPAGTEHRSYFPRRIATWIQVTRLGMTARYDGDRLSTWTRDISPARFLEPVATPRVQIIREGERHAAASNTGDAEGHASVTLPAPRRRPLESIAISSVGTDSTFIAFSGDRAQRSALLTWYVTDDRFMYKPGEPVHVKGWVRATHNGVNPDLAMPAAGGTITWSATDARRNKLGAGTATLSDQGGFDLKLDLPATAALGYATLSISLGNDATSHGFSIQEFKAPNYAVELVDDVQFVGAKPVYAGEQIAMRASAAYYAGGGLPGAPVKWRSELRATSYAPPRWPLFSFRRAGPRSRTAYYNRSEPYLQREEIANDSLSGSSSSEALLSIGDTLGSRPNTLEVEATVEDVDRTQIRAKSRPIMVHPSRYYVGLRPVPGDPRAITAIVADVDGEAVPGVPIDIEIEGVLGSERYRDDAVVKDTQRCTLTSQATPVLCEFTRTDVKFAYLATARVADERGRQNNAQLAIPWWSPDDRQEIVLVPDQAKYRPGDTAKIAIKSRSVPATAVVTIARNGIVRDQIITLREATTTLEVPIESAYVSNVHVLVDRWSVRKGTLPGSTLPIPAYDSAQVELPVDVEGARIELSASSAKKIVDPGAPATFTVIARKGGKPVPNAEVALMVVDEAVLALTNRYHSDPLPIFYRDYEGRAHSVETLGLVRDEADKLDGDPGFRRFQIELGSYGMLGHGSGTGSGMGFGGGRGSLSGASSAKIVSRKDFRPYALFSPLLHTDAQGRVTTTITMPDNLTRWRIVAIATANTYWFGKGENTVITQRLINARTVPPRFLTQGDRFSLPVIVQNLDSQPRTIDVAVRAANLRATGLTGQRVTLPAGQRAEVRFPFTTLARGTTAIQTAVTSQSGERNESDASTVNVQVYAPATTETFATYGVVDEASEREQLAVPRDIFPDVGGVELEVASTQMQSLTDAYWYLQAYPYECAEQRSSRMLATTAMYDMLDAFGTAGRPTKTELAAQREKDLKKLADTQQTDGGWGYFPGMRGDPYVTTQVLWAIAAQNATGPMRTRAIAAVDRIASEAIAALGKTAAVPADRRNTGASAYQLGIAASALSSLAAARAPNIRARAEKLHALATELGVYPVDVKARLLALVAGTGPRAMRTALTNDLLSAAHETAAGATVTTQYVEAERFLLPSENRTTALALDALIREVPQHALIPKLARGLLAARRLGRWRTTQENLVALSALRRYFDTYEAATPAYTARLWLGAAGYAEQAFAGRSGTRTVVKAGWGDLVPGANHALTLAKEGAGRMYYRVGITYAPQQVTLPALDAGFIVRRSYIPLDDPKDVEERADGTWRIKLGARIQVVLEATATTPRTQVALVDPLPAGLEAVNTALATSERAATVTNDSYWDYRATRDIRVEGFVDRFAPGVHRLSYTARAVTPGTFVAAPAKAEEMYSPETFGRSKSASVVIE